MVNVSHICCLDKIPPLASPCLNNAWTPCKKYDNFNNLWEARPGVVAKKPCPDGKDTHKFSSWECLPSGQFDGNSPNYTQCTSEWLEDLYNEVPVKYLFVFAFKLILC